MKQQEIKIKEKEILDRIEGKVKEAASKGQLAWVADDLNELMDLGYSRRRADAVPDKFYKKYEDLEKKFWEEYDKRNGIQS